LCYVSGMKRATVIAALKRHEAELRSLGVESVSLFGSAARGDAGDDSDVDLAVTLKNVPNGFAYFGRLDEIERLTARILKRRVDVVPEPTAKPRLRRAIDQDRVRAF
jgi:predicted nucleotidyltransferase